MLTKLGLSRPTDAITGTGPHAYHEDGMHYERCAGDNGRIYVAADHDAVGLVTWFDATQDDWEEIEDGAFDVIR